MLTLLSSLGSVGEVVTLVDLQTLAPITLPPMVLAWINIHRLPIPISLNSTSITSKPTQATSTRLRLPTEQLRPKPDSAVVVVKRRRKEKVSSRQFPALCNPARYSRRCRHREVGPRSHHSSFYIDGSPAFWTSYLFVSYPFVSSPDVALL